MFMDQYTNFSNVDNILQKVLNTAHGVVINRQTHAVSNVFIRKIHIKGQPFQDGTEDEDDSFTGATVGMVTREESPTNSKKN